MKGLFPQSLIQVLVSPASFVRITDGQGITKFCRIVCEQVRSKNVHQIIIVSPWITPRTKSEYNLQKMMDSMARSHKVNKDTVLLTVATRPPKLDDFMGSGISHAKAILQLLKHPICSVDIIPSLHTKLYYIQFKDDFMGGSFTIFGSANWTWQAESNTNHETLLEIQGQEERITEMFLHTLKDLRPMVTKKITSRTLVREGIDDIHKLCEYLASS